MNVSSALPSASNLLVKDAAPPISPIASLFENHASSSSSRASGSDKGSTPGQDVAKKLKALGEQFLAVMLITDPVARAKAASDLYKQFAQTGKEYAAATADGRAAAVAAETSATSAATAASDGTTPTDATAQADAADDEMNGAINTTPPTPTSPAAPADSAPQTPAVETTPMTAAAPTAPAVIYTPGKKSGFAADLYMEQIKSFASITQQVYQAAVEEARHKHVGKDKLHGLDDKMKDAKDTLTEAAKAVEGPAATADGYDPVAKAFPPADPPSLLNLTA